MTTTNSIHEESFLRHCNNYFLDTLIKETFYGKIYEISSKITQKKYVAKIQKRLSFQDEILLKQSALSNEAIILQKLKNKSGFPKFHDFILTSSTEILMTTRLGHNLEYLKAKKWWFLFSEVGIDDWSPMSAFVRVPPRNRLHSQKRETKPLLIKFYI